jgi:hypothetical protein
VQEAGMSGVNLRRLSIFTLVFIVVVGFLLYSGRAIIRDVIVVPLEYYYWLFGVLFKNVDQMYYWIIALVVAFVISYRSFLSDRKAREPEPQVPDIGPVPGRVEHWAVRVNLARMGTYYQTTFNEAVGRMALDLLAYRNRLTTHEVEKGLTDGTLRVPPDVREFILNNVLRRDFQRVPLLKYLYRAARQAILSRMHLSNMRRENLPTGPQHVIQYMEEELEVHYDNPGSPSR